MDLKFIAFILLTWLASGESAIDDIFKKAQEDFQERLEQGDGRLYASQAWDNYKMSGRDETFVKIQYDMLLTRDQWIEDFDRNGRSPFSPRGKRNALADVTKLWGSRIIPYEIDGTFDAKERDIIVTSMQKWSEFVCVSFVKADTTDYDKVRFRNDPKTCHSQVGRLQGRQEVGLAKSCMAVEIVIHEIGHVLGLYHEHMRYNRDEYVTIFDENIEEDAQRNFDKLKSGIANNHSKPYDYRSIMHYGKSFLAKPGLVTMRPKDVSFLDVIGEAKTLSFLDAQIVNDMYGCAEGCSRKTCPQGAFLGKNCECYCPGDDGRPIVQCKEPDLCESPNEFLENFDVAHFNQYSEDTPEGWTKGKQFPHRTTLELVFKKHCDEMDMGIDTKPENMMNITCVNGSWVQLGNVAECTPRSNRANCFVPEEWDSYYFDKNLLVDRDFIRNGVQIEFQCDSNPPVSINLSCTDGTFNRDLPPCYNESWCTIYDKSGDNIALYDYMMYQPKLSPGSKVRDGSIITAKCIRDRKHHESVQGRTVTYLSCNNGELEGILPDSCITVLYKCPMVAYSTMTGPGDGRSAYSVTCRPGYERRDADDNKLRSKLHFTCDYSIGWKPFTPKCVPADCIVEYDANGKLATRQPDDIGYGMRVASGSDVTLTCAHGYYPDAFKDRCEYGRFKSHENGKFPICKHVICPKPAVSAYADYSPTQDQYVYNDTISASRCRGNLYLNHPRNITCQKDGTWSGTISCEKFCDADRETFEIMNDKYVKEPRKRVSAKDFTDCKKKCIKRKRFCHSILFGYVERYSGSKKKEKACYLISEDVTPNSPRLKKKKAWTVGVRQCRDRKNPA